MKYRIKIITFKNGRRVYIPQVKMHMLWYGIFSSGEAYLLSTSELDSRMEALNRIDLHYSGNTKVQTIEFEYVTKP